MPATDRKIADGLAQLNAETARQFTDARDSFNAAGPAAEAAAAMIKSRNRLSLLGMGGSHWCNRMVVPAYRACGVDCQAEVVSEYQRAPKPGGDVKILVSQSGRSGEILRFLHEYSPARQAIGLTLNADTPLGQLPCTLVGQGGPEMAYAATRSLVITLALHARILQALGHDMTGFVNALDERSVVPSFAAVQALAKARYAVFCGRGALQGVAEAAALSLMELARIPVLALEAGQFRHGPVECVNADTAVIFLRGVGALADGIDALARDCAEAGATPFVLDFTTGPAVAGARHVHLPQRDDLAAAVTALASLQRIVIDAAAMMVDDVGKPLRSTKVTSAEAGA